jgi:flavin-dependent dehydrogenase
MRAAPEQFDVIVVGGGPAGAAAAAFCAQAGWSVALLEHKTFPRHKVCGDVINPGCWPVLERLGAAGNIRALPHHAITGARFTTDTGEALDVSMQTRAIRRSLFDAALLEHARHCGVTVREDEAAVEFSGQQVVTRRSRYLALQGIIGADGRHSAVARRLGLRRGRGDNGHIAFQGHFAAPATLEDRVQLHLFPGGYCGLVRVDSALANLCIVTDRASARYHDDCEALFARTVWRNRQFRDLGIAPEPVTPLHSAHPLAGAMNVPQRDRVWLAGDALQTREPFTGQGIFFALRTAELAAQAILTGSDYAAVVRALYRQRTRANAGLRRLMYHDRWASRAIRVLRRWPGAVRWLAENALAE